MSCDDFVRRLSDYAEGALPGDLCQELERHLVDCIPCEDLRRDLEDLRRLCREAAASKTPCLPAELRSRLEALLRKA